jgi:hypothetical protein
VEAPGIEASDGACCFAEVHGDSSRIFGSCIDLAGEPQAASRRFAEVQCSSVVGACGEAGGSHGRRAPEPHADLQASVPTAPSLRLPWQQAALDRLSGVERAIAERDHRSALAKCAGLLKTIVVEQPSVGVEPDADQAVRSARQAAARGLAEAIAASIHCGDFGTMRALALALLGFADGVLTGDLPARLPPGLRRWLLYAQRERQHLPQGLPRGLR